MKLVRDNIAALHAAGDLEPREHVRDWTFRRVADRAEWELLLRLKLVEELGEVLSAPTSVKRISELYDLRDVVDGFLRLEAAGDVHAGIHNAKLTRLGEFRQGWVLEE